MIERFRHYWAFLIVSIVALAAYGRNLDFVVGKFDEDVIITNNAQLLKDNTKMLDVVHRDAFFNRPGRDFYRPIQNLSLFIDTQIGNGRSWPYYLSNLLIHIATSWLLFRMLTHFGAPYIASLLLSLVFVSNPLFVQAVAWIPSRGDLLIAMFALLCLRAAHTYVERQSFWDIVTFQAWFACAMFSKETSILVPVCIALWWKLLHPSVSLTAISRLLLPSIGVVCLFFWTRTIVIPSFPTTSTFGLTPFIENLRVIPETIGKFFLPIGLAPLPSYTLSVSVIGGVICVLLAGTLMWLSHRNERGMALFGVMWFLLFTIPGMCYRHEIGSIAYDYLEHRAYLPMIGLVFAIGSITPAFVHRRLAAATCTLLLVVVFASAWYSGKRASAFRSSETFYNMAVSSNPKSGMALLNRGRLRVSNGDSQGAIGDYSQAIKHWPTFAAAFVNRGAVYRDIQRIEEAGADFLTATRLDTTLFEARFNLASWYALVNDNENALSSYLKAVRLRPDYANGWAMTGSTMAKLGNVEGSLPYFDRAISIDPSLTIVYLNRGKAFYNSGRREEACTDWSRGAALGNTDAAKLQATLCR